MYPVPLFPKLHIKGTSFVVYELDSNDKVNLNPGTYLLTFKVGYMLMNYLCNRKELVAYNRGFLYNGTTSNDYVAIDSPGKETYTSLITKNKTIHCIIRDPYKRFLSGIVQVALVPAQLRTTLKFMDTKKHKILRKITGGPWFKITKYAEGKFIDYFNGQFYGDYNFNSYQKVINNNYPPNKIVMGMLSEDVFNNFCYTYNVVKNLSNTYKNFGGVFIWEYYNAPPIVDFPILWSYYMYSALNNYSNCLN